MSVTRRAVLSGVRVSVFIVPGDIPSGFDDLAQAAGRWILFNPLDT